MVDACMRCLLVHGWLNFRMRAMVTSFAVFNLWLDWRKIAPHLARCFLDYEPGIHYPQLQMQSAVTGINAMRVYSATKQAKEQDARGDFIRRYVSELRRVPLAYLHTPSTMSRATQRQAGCILGLDYPFPIVDEKASAQLAKDRLSSVRKAYTTKLKARQVYQKHGSRSRRRCAQDQKALQSALGMPTVEVLHSPNRSASRCTRAPSGTHSHSRAFPPAPRASTFTARTKTEGKGFAAQKPGAEAPFNVSPDQQLRQPVRKKLKNTSGTVLASAPPRSGGIKQSSPSFSAHSHHPPSADSTVSGQKKGRGLLDQWLLQPSKAPAAATPSSTTAVHTLPTNAPTPPAQMSAFTPTPCPSWSCAYCTYHNQNHSRPVCDICSLPKKEERK